MFRQGRWLVCLALILSGSLLSGCRASSEAVPGPRAPAENGTLVPFVRPLPLVAMTTPMVVEFTLPPPGKSSSPTLFLGIRVGGEDGLKSLNTSREIRSMGLPAEVKLERLEAQKRIPVPLVRVESVAGTPARIEPIGPTGRVEGGWLDDVDHQSLQSAGLEAPDSHHTQLALAWAQELQPGHYRLSMQILKPDDRLAATQAELLVAYVNRSK